MAWSDAEAKKHSVLKGVVPDLNDHRDMKKRMHISKTCASLMSYPEQSVTPSNVSGVLDPQEFNECLEIRESLKRHWSRHQRASEHYRRRFYAFAAATLFLSSLSPVLEGLEFSGGQSKIIKISFGALTMFLIGLQNMCGYQTFSDQHFHAADEFDSLVSKFDFVVWYPSMCSTKMGPEERANKFLENTSDKIHELTKICPPLPAKFRNDMERNVQVPRPKNLLW